MFFCVEILVPIFDFFVSGSEISGSLMSGGGRAPASSRSAQPILQPLKRHLPFSTGKPPFVAPDDYHRFSSGSGCGGGEICRLASADDGSEALVMKSPVRFRIFFGFCMDCDADCVGLGFIA